MIAHEPKAGYEELRSAGSESARQCRVMPAGHDACSKKHVQELWEAIAARARGEEGRWLADNMRLIRTAVREVRVSRRSFRQYPSVVDGSGGGQARAYVVARQYLGEAENHFSEEGLTAFLNGYQEIARLEMGELWALKPAIQLVLLERIALGRSGSFKTIVESLRHVGEAAWKDLFRSRERGGPDSRGRSGGSLCRHGLREPRCVSESNRGTCETLRLPGARGSRDGCRAGGSGGRRRL